jgi:3-hydroxyisobutyrate dehydrogenase-like beta-hydroxyacid dehydrogenase
MVEMSTVGLAEIERLRGNLPATAGLLDSPVLGSLGEAEIGNLRSFVGGPKRLARAAKGWLEKAEREGRADEDYSAMLFTILGQGRNGESR